METLRERIFTNWSLMRWVRLVMGAVIAFQAIQLQDVLFGILSIFFIFQALSNTGCCGAAGCNVDPRAENIEKADHTKQSEPGPLKI
ncbi:MAG: hypothetical protein ACYCZO_05065 [Daejeonella sp.]